MCFVSFWNSIVSYVNWFISYILSWVKDRTAEVVIFDTGKNVRVGKQISEGGFSFVFEARDDEGGKKNGYSYALKQIRCADDEMIEGCRKEAAVHRSFGSKGHPNIMPLLGFTVNKDKGNSDHRICYMLFPRMTHSLRMEVNRRIFNHHSSPNDAFKQQQESSTFSSPHAPWNELAALEIFYGIVNAVEAVHGMNYSHRDIKLENILFENSRSKVPILMDFGSVGPLREPIPTRRRVLCLIEEAASHTTMPYRPPELFDAGGIRAGDDDIDYAKVDVWSLGCTLFAILYGTSPFECEFLRSDGQLRVVECTQLKVIGSIPSIPDHSPVARWYSAATKQLIHDMLTQDRHKRPSISQVQTKVRTLIHELGGQVDKSSLQTATLHPIDVESSFMSGDSATADFDSLLNNKFP